MHYMDVHHLYGLRLDPSARFGRGQEVIDPNVLFLKTAAMVRNPPPLELPEAELRQLIDQYDSCIFETDAEIARFVKTIEELSTERETVVIFTSDHGNEFLEHGSLYHTNLLVEELIRVPLIIWRSGTKTSGSRVKPLVRHVDVLPTVAEFIGVDPPEEASGVSLFPYLLDAAHAGNNYSIAEGDFCTSLNFENWKLMHVDSAGSYELYDLAADPLGLRDVSDLYPSQLGEMKARLGTYLEKVKRLENEAQAPLSVEQVRQLKALGYLQ
jgi:arylsulfatase A-like enzyme